ncbi:MAG: HesA/MoeB/ThiF family protein [Alphaproteobacteria bacterium]|nr:HesA/MoeB/ThiF family protein [Alphaproteobacteria bacterium]
MNLNRYDRQIRVTGFGIDGQDKLSKARILVVGAGGLGAACLPYLAGAGVGHISIMDADIVELSNLHRQTLYNEDDIGCYKAEVAAQKLSLQNSEISVVAMKAKLGASDAQELARQFDLIVDCTDNYNAKYSINDACIAADIPMVSASIEGMSGYLGVFGGQGYPSYRALFNEPALNALNCADSGVLGTVAGIFGLMQAHEVIKHLAGLGEVTDRVIMLDLFDFSMRKIKLSDGFESRFKPFDIVELADKGTTQLLDVRELDEFEAEHHQGAVHWASSEISVQVDDRLEASQALILYCAKGARAETAAIRLQQAGFENLSLLSTGMG